MRNVYTLIKNDNVDINDPKEQKITLKSVLNFL